MAKFTISALDSEGIVQSTHTVPVQDYADASFTLAATLTIATMNALVNSGTVPFGVDYVETLRKEWESHDGSESFEIRKTRERDDLVITDLFQYSV